MIIHVVQEGETLHSISDKYRIPEERLILDNGITNANNLATGQTVVIVYPLITYTVDEGDTLVIVAAKHNVSVMELLRNNPHLSDRETLYPGETIVISYETNRIREVTISGYTYPFINIETLRKTLPYLTYITIFNYQYTFEGAIIDIDDSEVIQLAREYGVAPMMLLSTLSERGIGSLEVATNMLTHLDVQMRLIDNVMDKLKEKGYYGLNIYLKYLRPENRTLVEEYIVRMSKRLKSEGFRLLITVTPKTTIEGNEITYENMDYSTLSQYVDGILFLSYDWSFSFGPPASATPLNIVRDVLDNATALVPSELLFLGFPVIGYDWELPYIPGSTMARAITYDVAIELAALTNAPILYNEISAAPYYFYMSENQDLHIVWFKDSRSINAISSLVPEYNLQGLSIWNIMRFFAQLWLVINTQYEIQKIENINIPSEGPATPAP